MLFSKYLKSLFVLGLLFAVPARTEVIDPIAQEKLGQVRVSLPALGETDYYVTAYYTLFGEVSGAMPYSLAANVIKRIPEGNYCLKLEAQTLAGQWTSKKCGIKLVEGKLTDIELNALNLSWDPEPFRVNIGLTAEVRLAGTNNPDIPQIILSPAAKQFSDENKYIPVFQDQLEISAVVPGLTSSPIGLKYIPGKGSSRIIKEKVTFPDIRAKVLIVPSKNRAFAPVSYPGMKCHYNGTIAIQSEAYFVPDQEFEVLAFPWQTLELNFGGQQTIALQDGYNYRVELKRLDVNDVRVTTEDGSTFMTKGKYTVNRLDAKNKPTPVAVSFQSSNYFCKILVSITSISSDYFDTKTGIDVLPGKYQIKVDFSTLKGADSRTYEIQL